MIRNCFDADSRKEAHGMHFGQQEPLLGGYTKLGPNLQLYQVDLGAMVRWSSLSPSVIAQT
jgi:hypothetical protein